MTHIWQELEQFKQCFPKTQINFGDTLELRISGTELQLACKVCHVMYARVIAR